MANVFDNWGKDQGWNIGGKPNGSPPSSNFGFDLSKFDGFDKNALLMKLILSNYPGALNSGFFASGWGEPNFEKSLMDSFNLATPEGARARSAGFKRASMESAATQGRNSAQVLRSQGLSNSAQSGALLDALNQGAERSSEYDAATTDPSVLAQKRAQIAGSAGEGPAARTLLQLFGAGGGGQQDQGGGGGNLLDDILGLASFGTGLGVDWGKVFHF